MAALAAEFSSPGDFGSAFRAFQLDFSSTFLTELYPFTIIKMTFLAFHFL
jgi:hypothetical protein